MTDQTSSWESFLRLLPPPEFPDGLVMRMISDMVDEAHRREEAILGALGEHERRVELTRRRIVRAEARFRAALDFTPCSCQDDW